MKRITSMVAVLAAAMALGAVFSAGASADTALCAKAVTDCAPSDMKPQGTYFTAGGTYSSSFKVNTTYGPVLDCSFNLMTAKSLAENGNPLSAEFQGVLNASKCIMANTEEPTCSSATMNSPPTTIEATGSGAGIVRIGSATQPLTVSWGCFFPEWGGQISCTYAATGTVTMTLHKDESVTVNASPMSRTAGNPFACWTQNPTLSVSDIKDSASPYIANATETVLCNVGSPCPANQIAPAGSSFVTGSPGSLSVRWSGEPLLDCKGDTIAFRSTAESGASLPAETYTYVPLSKCIGFMEEKANCSSVTLNTPPSTIQATGSETGVVRIGTASQPLTVAFSCTSYPITCSYAATGPVEMQITNVAATVKAASLVRTGGSEFMCGQKVTLDINNNWGHSYIGFIK